MVSTVIDHAIAIPAKQSKIWAVLSDISKNPLWQTDCEDVRFLTTLHSGRGTRWRNTAPAGREYVVEITAWYAGLGYEYLIVDGMNIENTRGRIRLQEAAEGTIVQWTFNYEMRGLFSGVRNSLIIKRHLDNDIVDSLRNLYSYVKALSPDEFNPNEIKSIMQDAPDVNARSMYQPRYTPTDDIPELTDVPAIADDVDSFFKPPAAAAMPSAEFFISEPPIKDDDTKPNPLVSTSDEIPPVTVEEPAFLHDLPAAQAPSAPSIEATQQPEADIRPPARFQLESPATGAIQPLNLDKDVAEISALDTAQISVFEVFGLQKPSESEQVRAIREDAIRQTVESAILAEPALIADVTPDDSDARRRRLGLRARLRNRRANVRHPS